MPRLAYIRWHDACYREGERELTEVGTGEILNYYGLLVKETPVAVTLAMEEPHEGRTRNPFDILLTNILEMKVVDTEQAFKPKKVRVKRVVATPVPIEMEGT